jgi:hypothetical protein
MADESDNADDVPMDKKSSDTVKVEHDDIMERINKILEDLNNENK